MNQRVLVNIGQIIILNFIYILINVISLGLLVIPSTSTLFHFIKKIRNKTYDPFDMLKPFFRMLVSNTKDMIGIQIIFLVIVGISFFNASNIEILTYPLFLRQTLLIVYIIVIIESLLLIIVISYLKNNYVFKTNLDIIKMSFFLVHRHMIITIIIIGVLFIISYILFVYSIFIALAGVFVLLFYLVDILYKPKCEKYIIKGK